MKKLTTIIICLLLITKSYAERRDRDKVDVGLKVGVNFNQVNGDYWNNGYKANLMAGAYLFYKGGMAGISIEPLYTQSTFVTGQGFGDLYADFYQSTADTIQKGTFQLNYYNVPVLLNIKILPRIWLQLGPQFSGVLSVKDNDHLLKDAESFFSKAMISGVGGLWINLPAGITISGRYVLGLNDININSNTMTNNKTIEDQWKQKMLQVGIGFTFL